LVPCLKVGWHGVDGLEAHRGRMRFADTAGSLLRLASRSATRCSRKRPRSPSNCWQPARRRDEPFRVLGVVQEISERHAADQTLRARVRPCRS